MRILVLGATGGVGLEIVRNAIDQGHSVTALVRSPQRLHPFGSGITVLSGNLLNRSDLHTCYPWKGCGSLRVWAADADRQR